MQNVSDKVHDLADEGGRGPRRRRLRAFLRKRSAIVGFTIIVGAALLALSAPLLAKIASHPPQAQYRTAQFLAPGAHAEGVPGRFWLGSDDLGQDVLVRFAYGARKSLLIGLWSVLLALLVGVPGGLLCGYFGGWTDFLGMRLVDIMLAFPSILLAIVVMAALGGKPDERNVVIAVGLVNVPVFARQVRASVLSIKELDYVTANRALGAGHLRLMFRTILPNTLAPIIVLATLGLGTAMLSAAGLSFLGLGVEPGTPEWGAMLTKARDFMRRAPWAVLVPGLAITFTVLGFNLLGDGLRDALDPKSATKD
ncbi:MAG: ABC transporter permease [Planctomycetota bacterium]|jgi:peptide/nickel transport system permease protein